MKLTCKECGIIVDESNKQMHEASHVDLNRFILIGEVKRIIEGEYETIEDYKSEIKNLRQAYFNYKGYGFKGWEK